MFLVWRKYGKPDPSMAANGMLAGLVAITAPCAFVDPIGAVSVHGICGVWGVLAVGLFADGSYGAGWNGVEGTVTGLFYGGGLGQLGAQVITAAVAAGWAFGTRYAFFKVQDRLQGIRVTRDEETIGLDVPEMGVAAYPDSFHL